MQMAGKVPLNVNECNIDLMSISGHKMYGPKGIGALYVRRSVDGGMERASSHPVRGTVSSRRTAAACAGICATLSNCVARPSFAGGHACAWSH